MDKDKTKEEMICGIRAGENGLSSKELAERYLKFKSPSESMVRQMIGSILNGDPRCSMGKDGRWHALEVTASSEQLSSWVVIYVLADPKTPNHALHVSVWSADSETEQVASEWLVDPEAMTTAEQEQLRDAKDAPFNPSLVGKRVSSVCCAVNGDLVVFLNSRQQGLFSRLCNVHGEEPPENTLLIRHLFKAAGRTVPRSFDLEFCGKEVAGEAPVLSSALRYGQVLRDCVKALFSEARATGINSREGLEEYEQPEAGEIDWARKSFSIDDVRGQPETPGVYGFKDERDTYIYIGKAHNLRRRLLTYFRDTEESPAKLAKLRDKSVELTVHRCGSELESLIYEYRLVRKHEPELNTQIRINERKGEYTPLDDSIVLLPHVSEGKGMSVWFRREQKIRLRAFCDDFSDFVDLRKEAQDFFYRPVLTAEQTDFPEQEIVFRWIKRHRDSLIIVPVSRLSGADEIVESMQSYWADTKK